METLGQFLKRERELREISVDDIAHSTKIRKSYIESIETDQLEKLPGRTFVIGFLRAYAQTIGLDDNEVVNRYLDVVHQQSEITTPSTPQPTKNPQEASQSHILLYIIIAAIIVLLFWLIVTY